MAYRGVQRGGARSASVGSSKQLKRDHGWVSPVSPKMSASDFRRILKEGLNEINTELSGINNSIVSMKDNFGTELDSIKTSVATIKQDITELTADLQGKIDDLALENNRLKRNQCQSDLKINTLTDRIVSLESQMRRDNLKFLNIKTQNVDEQMNCEEIILALCRDMNILLESKDIVRAHTIGPKVDDCQAIIVKFQHFKDKMRILKAKGRFREIGILVVEDFPVEVLERRKTFSPVIKAAYDSNGKYRARLVKDKLLLNGRLYTTDEISNLPAELQSASNSTITRDDITAFFTYRSPLSNHYPCQIEIEDQQFSSVEQFLMLKKATFFNDKNTSQKISSPKQAKALGKWVKVFHKDSWNGVCDAFMKSGLEVSTGSTKLVEANPHDQYWGVGLDLHDSKIWDPMSWAGKNTLGKLLEDIRGEQ